MTAIRPLGKRQQGALRALHQHGSWAEGRAERWNDINLTTPILEALVRRDLVEREVIPVSIQGWQLTPRIKYTLTPAGAMLVATLK